VLANCSRTLYGFESQSNHHQYEEEIFFLFCDRTLLGEQLSDPLNFSNSTHVPLVAIMEFITATSSQEVSIDIKMFVLTNYVFNI